MYVVINTQHRENYGAHDWDGEGACPQYWKYKGGSTYIVTCDLWTDDIQKEVLKLIEFSNDFFQEYLLQVTLVDHRVFKESDFCEEWEHPTYLKKVIKVQEDGPNGWWEARKVYKPEFPHHHPRIKWHFETWTQLPFNERKDYSHEVSVDDGECIPWAEYVEQWRAEDAA